MKISERAKVLAHEAHDSIKQIRKYTGEPYWVHTDEVAALVQSIETSEEGVAAAHLHDVLEDVFPVDNHYSLELIQNQFGPVVAQLVFELTAQFTRENFPLLSRAQRKEGERQRLSKASVLAKTIKLADIISNTSDIVQHDAEFAVTYLKEKELLLP